MDVASVHFEPIATMDVKAAQKADFAVRLKAAIKRKGWSMSETARRASSFLGKSEKFGRAHIWHYVQGRALPRTRYLEALSLALDVRPDDLMPMDPAREHGAEMASVGGVPEAGRTLHNDRSLNPSSMSPGGMVHLRDYGDGTALLEVSERVPWETALAILQILKKNPG